MIKKILKQIKSLFFWDTLKDLNALKVEVAELKQLSISAVQINQVLLNTLLQKDAGIRPLSLGNSGFKVHSQFEEDGMLLYIFSIIGTGSKKCVEIGCSDGRECNTTNFILYHGWRGLLLDGSKENVDRGNIFFKNHPLTRFNPPLFKAAWITKDNIDSILKESGFTGEVDLLSIDIDGNDYYILDAITVIKPRVILCEVNGWIPPDVSNTIPYQEDFYCWDKPYPQINFRSMSPAAAVKLMAKKGYRLIGAHREGFNFIFIQSESGTEHFPTISAADIYNKVISSEGRKIWEDTKGLNWETV